MQHAVAILNRCLRSLAVLPLLLALAACATRPPLDTDRVVSADDFTLPEYRVWQFRGRVSITRAEEGWHAGMNWRETAGRYRLNLSGPLGQGAVRLDGDDRGVVLRTADGRTYAEADADALVAAATGWQFPVEGIRYWVRGVPAPGNAITVINVDVLGQLVRLEQSGWDIRYDRYQTLDGRGWPTRMHLSTDDITVRLVIDEWLLEDGARGTQPPAGDEPGPVP